MQELQTLKLVNELLDAENHVDIFVKLYCFLEKLNIYYESFGRKC